MKYVQIMFIWGGKVYKYYDVCYSRLDCRKNFDRHFQVWFNRIYAFKILTPPRNRGTHSECEPWAFPTQNISTRLLVLRTPLLVSHVVLLQLELPDYVVVAEKLKQEGRHEIFEQETMEELEDDEGNVYNRKTYEDLKKQGLI